MSVTLWEGPAGSGKTYQLMRGLAGYLEEHPLAEYQMVLAITKMHGSRRRMQDRLAAVSGLRSRFRCVTLDSFAWRLLRRWRSLAELRFDEPVGEADYNEVCARAGGLLAEQVVSEWIARTFPVVLVDELQDSQAGQLSVVQGLVQSVTCLVAADGFQDLNAERDNAAVVWAREAAGGEGTVTLTTNRRTKQATLLAAAVALREGSSLVAGTNFALLGARNKNHGASYVSQNLTWSRGKEVAVISPVGAHASAFVRGLLARVAAGPIGSKNPVGPHTVPWEASHKQGLETLLQALALPDEPSALIARSTLPSVDDQRAGRLLAEALDRDRRLAGKTDFTVAELRDRATAAHQRMRAFGSGRGRRVRAMTIHQAKNREFESVIVLWPYEVQGSTERKRRLLYNAVTRAQRRAVVIVQNPDRLKQPPFVAESG